MCIPEKRKKHPQVQNWKKMINVLIGNRANGIHHSDNIDCALQKKKIIKTVKPTEVQCF